MNTYTVIGTHDGDADEFAVATAVIPGDQPVTWIDLRNEDLLWVEVVKADSPYDAANIAVNEVDGR